MVSRRAFLAGSAGGRLAACSRPAQAPAETERRRALSRSRGSSRACSSSPTTWKPPPRGQAVRHHVGAARLSLLQGHARDQFRQAGDRGLRQGSGSTSCSSTSSARARSRISTARSCRKSDWPRSTACASRRPSSSFRSVRPGWRRASRASAKSRGRRATWCRTPFLAMFRFVAERAYEKGSLPTTYRQGRHPVRVRRPAGIATARSADLQIAQSPCPAARRPSPRRTARISGTHPCASWPDRCSGACR